MKKTYCKDITFSHDKVLMNYNKEKIKINS